MFIINQQVNGTYAGQAFTGKVVDVTALSTKTYLTIQLDEAIEVRHKGTLTTLNIELNAEGNFAGVIQGFVVAVASGTVATAARERCVSKRAQAAGVSAEYAAIMLGTFNMKKWHHTLVARIIIDQWNKENKVAV